MENASRALIMAATVLLGIMIMTVGIVLFSTFGNFSSETMQALEDKQIAEFNAQFTKYYYKEDENITGTDDLDPHLYVTIHDIVSVANLAKENNTQYGFADTEEKSNESSYIQIDVTLNDKNGKEVTKENFEKLSKGDYTEYIKQNDIFLIGNNPNNPTKKKFFCNNIEYSTITKKVIYMQFLPAKKY